MQGAQSAMEVVESQSKRPRVGDEHAVSLTTTTGSVLASLQQGKIPRTSSLEAPTMLLTGHGDAVLSLKFSPDGEHLASGSRDHSVFLWNVRGDCKNYAALVGHKNAVLEVQWMAQHDRLLSCSADKTVRAWDAETGEPVKKLAEHSAVVNSVCPARRGAPLLVSGSDDGTVRVWDLRTRKSVHRLVSENAFAVTAVSFGEGQETVYSGGLDNELHAWDLRTGEVSMTLEGHTDTVTGLALSPDGSFLLSNAMDNTLRVWDVRPFAPPERCVKVMTGHAHNFEKNLLRCAWSPDGKKVSAGSADRNTYIWTVETASLEYKLPGHKGSVNEVVFHPSEPIVGSASNDSTMFLGELAA